MARLSRDVRLDVAGMVAAQDEVEAFLEGQGIDPPLRGRVRLVMEEIVANLLLHGRFEGEPQPARLGLSLAEDVLVTLDDAAAPFDPRATEVEQCADLGGRGLRLVRHLAAIRSYRRLPDGWNRLELALRYG